MSLSEKNFPSSPWEEYRCMLKHCKAKGYHEGRLLKNGNRLPGYLKRITTGSLCSMPFNTGGSKIAQEHNPYGFFGYVTEECTGTGHGILYYTDTFEETNCAPHASGDSHVL